MILLDPLSTAATEALPAASPVLPDALEAMACDYVGQWFNGCSRFLRWHREHFLQREPDEQARRDCARALPWLIRVSRIMHGQMLDPTWSHPQLARQVEATLRQLEEVWAQTQNPMSDGEADGLLAKYFPDEPRT